MAYNKYQQHQSQKPVPTLPAPIPRSSPATTGVENLEKDQITAAILKTSGINPPSYHEAVMNHAAVPPEPSLYVQNSKAVTPVGKQRTGSTASGEEDDLSDDEEFFEVANGIRQFNSEMQTAQESFIKRWRENRGEDKPMSWWEAKKARKAAKWEAKGKRKGYCA